PETEHLVAGFRRRALSGAVVAGALAVVLLPLLWRDAPVVAERFPTRGVPFVAVSVCGGVGALVLVWRRHYTAARLAAGLAVAGVLWGWAAAQYPDLVVGQVAAASAAAPTQNLRAMLIAIGFGVAVLLPALFLLFRVFADPEPAGGDTRH
ncbi:cytochrome d ubiquinol oxidase subunit II, partial [Candidatus Protofrankia californiensis]|uniref:cytochrome d ubiquinol oxidase subunit II n=1 Tax=Candidatus Protofrankia californiensis TaxID=1839754 RepID=UPI0013EE19C8